MRLLLQLLLQVPLEVDPSLEQRSAEESNYFSHVLEIIIKKRARMSKANLSKKTNSINMEILQALISSLYVNVSQLKLKNLTCPGIWGPGWLG